jgi:hypothetical protein
VSLHTDIHYRLAESIALTVNGAQVLPSATFADHRGQPAVKCSMAITKEMVGMADATCDLTVTGRDGATHSGTGTIPVMSQAGASRKTYLLPPLVRSGPESACTLRPLAM